MLPLPYGELKDFMNGPKGMNLNPFFGRWMRIGGCPSDLQAYRSVIDAVNGKVYDHPYITRDGLTMPANYYTTDGGDRQISFGDLLNRLGAMRGCAFVNTATVDGQYLLIVKESDAQSTSSMANAGYRTLAAQTKAAAIRAVEPSDRQVHWVWFRKSPSYKLSEEIVLRAASWIELNPGYTFHLWTNLVDAEELQDFLSALPEDLRDRYFKQSITVHYDAEFRGVVFDWVQQYAPELLDLYKQVWESKERQDTVMKTDYCRNILLDVFGGIYTDFNDLVCLASIEPVLEAHAGRCIGVTDNTTHENTSNYFMYSGKGCQEWHDRSVECFRTMPDVRALIYSEAALDTAKRSALAMADGQFPDNAELQARIDEGFAYRMETRHFIFALGYGLSTYFPSSPFLSRLGELIRKSAHGRMKKSFMAEIVDIFRSNKDEVAALVASDEFPVAWRFGRTDMYLSPIMHRCNLPIFCREQKKPLTLLPFGYLLRYSCLFSYVGHLGDATSYGRDPMNKTTMRRLLGLE